MRFYQENKINPFASCIPLLLQLPVFFALFYLLRSDPRLRQERGRIETVPPGPVAASSPT